MQLSHQDVVMASSSTSATPPWPAPEAFIWSNQSGRRDPLTTSDDGGYMSSEVQVTCGVLDTMVQQSGDGGWKNVEGVIINADKTPQGMKEGDMCYLLLPMLFEVSAGRTHRLKCDEQVCVFSLPIHLLQ
ncbi:hypothetical protein OPV22_005602 [Ensete ventricosum]|uniref:Uncharacterized protein n=1 Tax=Ensete ventricosum TaxID=4639 RepID=A0AAV8Q397_ENSVE|nr:hypothetical protein OPV22_005602 [Ensete ventricosum]